MKSVLISLIDSVNFWIYSITYTPPTSLDNISDPFALALGLNIYFSSVGPTPLATISSEKNVRYEE